MICNISPFFKFLPVVVNFHRVYCYCLFLLLLYKHHFDHYMPNVSCVCLLLLLYKHHLDQCLPIADALDSLYRSFLFTTMTQKSKMHCTITTHKPTTSTLYYTTFTATSLLPLLLRAISIMTLQLQKQPLLLLLEFLLLLLILLLKLLIILLLLLLLLLQLLLQAFMEYSDKG